MSVCATREAGSDDPDPDPWLTDVCIDSLSRCPPLASHAAKERQGQSLPGGPPRLLRRPHVSLRVHPPHFRLNQLPSSAFV